MRTLDVSGGRESRVEAFCKLTRSQSYLVKCMRNLSQPFQEAAVIEKHNQPKGEERTSTISYKPDMENGRNLETCKYPSRE